MTDATNAGEPFGNKPRVAVYTCTYASYDILLSPQKMTPGCDYIAFVDQTQSTAKRWDCRPLPAEVENLPQNEANRYCKLFPMRILPEYDISIYLDGNIFIGADLTPLIDQFIASGADLALFPGQGNRTVEEEIELTLERGAVREDRVAAAQRQLADLRAKGEADLPITMNGVLFRKHASPHLEPLMQAWWEDINKYAMRDQYGLPGLLNQSPVQVHHWDWQYFYTENPYFSVRPHRTSGMGWWAEQIHASQARRTYALPDRILWSLHRRITGPFKAR